MATIDRDRLRALLAVETEEHRRRTPASRAAFETAEHLFGGVPMTWMNKWSGGYPLYLATAHGNRIVDLDGHEYVDFALGDTAAMAGHSPAATVAAVQERISVEGGITTMMPSLDAEWVAAELTRRFGMPLWSFSLSATDANRWALRIARMVTGRDKVMAFSYCYHGSVDETFVIAGLHGSTQTRGGNVGPAIHVSHTSRGGGVQRHRLGGIRTRGGRRSRPHHGTGPHEHRHRPARAGFPRRGPGPLHEVRDPPADRRDAHDLGWARGLHGAVGAAARHLRHRQEHRWWHPDRGVRDHRVDRGGDPLAPDGRPRGRRRRGRDVGRQRDVDSRDARHPGRGAHGGGVRAHDRLRHPLP